MTQQSTQKTTAKKAAEQAAKKKAEAAAAKKAAAEATKKKKAAEEAAKKKSEEEAAKEAGQGQKLIKVKFTKSPFGKFKLPYYIDQEKQLPEALAREVIKAQYAVKV